MAKISVEKRLESQDQSLFIKWCNDHGFYTSHAQWQADKEYKGIVFAVPNGGKRNAVEVLGLKKEGMLTGTADVVVVLPAETLFFEFKTDIGKQSEKQKEFQAVCGQLGKPYYLVRKCFEGVQILKKYM